MHFYLLTFEQVDIYYSEAKQRLCQKSYKNREE
jgi:hypothetical protein